jgi:hypothetical protein
MTDITTPLTELRAAYRAYQNAKRDKKEEIREKYEARIADEVRAAVEAEKYAFAKLLADRKEFYDLRVTDIQDHVLRTRNWKVWEDIRDYADIAPEQVTRENAKAERDRPYRMDDTDSLVLWWLKDAKGKAVDNPLWVRFDAENPTIPDVEREQLPAINAAFGSLGKFYDAIRPTLAEVFTEKE